MQRSHISGSPARRRVQFQSMEASGASLHPHEPPRLRVATQHPPATSEAWRTAHSPHWAPSPKQPAPASGSEIRAAIWNRRVTSFGSFRDLFKLGRLGRETGPANVHYHYNPISDSWKVARESDVWVGSYNASRCRSTATFPWVTSTSAALESRRTALQGPLQCK